jgi:hypothetical protein
LIFPPTSIGASAIIAPLTPEEKLAVREVEVLSLQLQAQMSALQARSKEVAQQFADASQAMDKAVKAIYAKRKIDQADYQLCEQPGPGACASAPAGDLTLQPVPKEGKK